MNIDQKFIEQCEGLLRQIDNAIPQIQEELILNKKPISSFIRGGKVPGVYAFFITSKHKTNYYDFEQLWRDDTIVNYSKVSAINFQRSTQAEKKSHTLYLGKSEKIDDRINEHLTQSKNSTTYGLKLNGRTELFKNYELFYSRYELKNMIGLDPSIIQFVITRVESNLRGKMNPWVGKQ